MHNFAQRDVVDVAINEARARSIPQRLAIQSLHSFVVSNPTLSEIEIRCKAGSVREQLFDGDRVAAFALHFRNELHDRIA